YFSGRPSLVRELRVREGGAVRAGQLIAVLDGRRELEAALGASEARIDLARNRVAQVRAGARPPELQAQRAEVRRIEALLENAEAELRRYEKLRQHDDVSAAELDAKRTAVLSTRQMLEQARNRVENLGHVRQVDVDVAEAELRAAVADSKRARAELEST